MGWGKTAAARSDDPDKDWNLRNHGGYLFEGDPDNQGEAVLG